jgi:AraC-like DNA-binding protein/quercetin dioxygenase-like cupin family protein
MSANQQIKKYPKHQMLTRVMQMPAGYVDDWHAHSWHQIIFPLKGLLQSKLRLNSQEKLQNRLELVKTKSFIVPHNGILYIPANTAHKSVAVTNTEFMSIYLNPNENIVSSIINYSKNQKSCLLTPLLKALIIQLFNESFSQQPESIITNHLRVLRDQIAIATSYEIPLLMPQDRRLLAIFTALQQQPDLPLTLADWAIKVGASQRTLSRICAKEFDQSFSLWRRNIKLVLSLQLLEKQVPIQDIAMDLGYKSDSAYIYAFKGLFTQTPSKYRKNYLL